MFVYAVLLINNILYEKINTQVSYFSIGLFINKIIESKLSPETSTVDNAGLVNNSLLLTFPFPSSLQCCCRVRCPSTWTRKMACRSAVHWRTCSATPSSSLRTARGNGECHQHSSSVTTTPFPPHVTDPSWNTSLFQMCSMSWQFNVMFGRTS